MSEEASSIETEAVEAANDRAEAAQGSGAAEETAPAAATEATTPVQADWERRLCQQPEAQPSGSFPCSSLDNTVYKKIT